MKIDLDAPNNLTVGDPRGMVHVVKEFPSQCRRAHSLADHLPQLSSEKYHRVLVCGMGGSAIAGDLLKLFLQIPVAVHRDYDLPHWGDDHTLLCAISYSGNTEETLSAVYSALERHLQPVCLSSGGRLRELAYQKKLPYIEIPSGLQPRAALAYLAMPLLAFAARTGLTTELLDFAGAIAELELFSKELAPESPTEQNLAKKLAQILHGRVPLIYGVSHAGEVVARRWKTQLNENAKQPAFFATIPELCHNEIVPLERLAEQMPSAMVLFLRDADERPEHSRRVEILKELLRQRRVPFAEIPSLGETRLGRLLTQIHLGDYVSLYLALLNGVDPTPVEAIEELKRRMQA